MFYLAPSTAAQTVYLTLREGRYFQDETFTHFLMVLTGEQGGEQFALILDVDTETERYNAVTISTAADTPTTSAVLIPNEKAGDYFYVVYGQNSATNLDPEDAVVVGVVERGRCRVNTTTTFFEDNQPEITPDLVYAG